MREVTFTATGEPLRVTETVAAAKFAPGSPNDQRCVFVYWVGNNASGT